MKMSFKRPLSVSPPIQQLDGETTGAKMRKSPESNLCRICGDQARIINYGTLSCQSCRTFFRRNGFRPEAVRPCTFNKCCDVNMQTRHSCTSCRLAKCFRMGMSSEMIRKEEEHKTAKSPPSTGSPPLTKSPPLAKSNTTELVAPRAMMPLLQLPTFDLIHSDRSSLTNSEWTLISNIVHAYDTYSIDSQVRRTIEGLSTVPVASHSHVINPLNIVTEMYKSMQSFISSTPDFRVLTVDEQSSLLDRNLHGVVGFCSTLFFRSTRNLHNHECLKAYADIYGSDMLLQASDIYERLDPDSTVIKMILIILAFSSNCFTVDRNVNIQRDSLLFGTFRLFGSQNVYVELLWKYMIYRYDYNESALRFTRLITTTLRVLKNVSIIYTNNEDYRKVVNYLVEESKQSLNVNVNKQAPLWGKT